MLFSDNLFKVRDTPSTSEIVPCAQIYLMETGCLNIIKIVLILNKQRGVGYYICLVAETVATFDIMVPITEVGLL